IEHPALTLVMTTDEETGMNGARAVDPALLDADCLVNLDSEEEGVLLAGCAGGVRVDVCMSGNVLRMRGRRAVLKIEGLLGGHSGMEIVKERGNAVLIAGRILQALRDDGCVFGIAGASGGDADNAIPAATAVDLVFPADEENGIRRAQETIRCEAAAIRRELGRRDPDLTCALVRPGSSDPADGTEPVSDGVPVLDEDLAERTAAFLCTAPNGVQSMSADLPGLVETSLNLGVMRTELPDRAELCFGFALRSSRESARDALRRRLELLAGRFGAESTISGEYNGWAFDPDSRICGHFADTWERMNGSRPRIEAIHAGLECGLFRGLKPGLDCVSLGPDLEHVHTTKERMHIASAGRTWAFLLEALRTWDVKK
nr:M20/M25/M40 family metallo-hydrolase [Lachnospiraceae bacterium]